MDHSSRDNKVAIISDKAKSLFRVGNSDSLLHLCGIAVWDSLLPHRSISPIVSLTSTLPSMASSGTICSTFWLNHPTNPQESASFPLLAIMQQSLSSVWLLSEIPSTRFLYQVQLLFNLSLSPPSQYSTLMLRVIWVSPCSESLVLKSPFPPLFRACCGLTLLHGPLNYSYPNTQNFCAPRFSTSPPVTRFFSRPPESLQVVPSFPHACLSLCLNPLLDTMQNPQELARSRHSLGNSEMQQATVA
jgi:hypothetical protein